MRFQIREIVLWPRKPGLPLRRVKFEPGRVNVISGVSKTGKSAIIPIIDYCLASDKCSIPVNVIRRSCSWFGIIVDTPFGQKLLARREPGQQQATADMFVLEGHEIVAPEAPPERNASADSVKNLLNELAGLTQLNFDVADSGLGYKGRPSFRDMVAFSFLPQNIVANPNALFYKADTSEHREKLRTIFPYILGAVDAEVLAVQHELQRLRLELRRKERELASARQVSLRWIAEIESRVSLARELGLLVEAPANGASVEGQIALLRRVLERLTARRTPLASAVNVEGAADELANLQSEEADVSSSLTQLKRRHADMQRLRSTAIEYGSALTVKRDRLAIADWIGDVYDRNHECPMCGTRESARASDVAILTRALRQAEAEAGDFASVPAVFDREFSRVKEEIDSQSERLRAIGIRRRGLEQRSDELRARHYAEASAMRFVGSLEEALKQYDALAVDSDLVQEIAELEERVSGLHAWLNARKVDESIDRAKAYVSGAAARILPALDTERPNDPIRLLPDELTIQVVGKDREDYLWEIGSGANWLAYHLAVSLGLHELFLSLRNSPVPSFTVYDQPSQVYFPRRLSLGEGEGETTYRDEDVEAVKKIFAVLSNAAVRHGGEWQGIVLDHVPRELWEDLPGIHAVEDWRDGRKLVPEDWLIE